MMTGKIAIEVDARTAEALRAQATMRGLTVEAYLRNFAELHEAGESSPPAVETKLDVWLDELAGASAAVGSLPTDFSRADIYADHD